MLTLNIEDDSVRITRVKGKRVVSAVEGNLTAGWVQNGVVIDKDAVSQQIINLLNTNNIREREAIACVSGVHSIYRVVYVPKLERGLLAEAARKEMERVSPVPLETLYTSWQDVKISGIESALCLLGLPHDNVDSVMDTLKMCGLRLKSLELKPLAIDRVVDEQTAVVINIQVNGFDISVLDSGIPELMRSLTFAQTDMSEPDKIAMINDEIARTVNFYNSSHADRQLHNNAKCFLSGDLSEGLAQVIPYSVKPLPSNLVYPAGIDEGRFAANTGMALKGTGGTAKMMRVNIDVMPRLAAVKPSARTSTLPLFALAIASVIFIATYILYNSMAAQNKSLQMLINDRIKQVVDMQKAVKEKTDKAAVLRDQYQQTLNALKAPLDYLAQERASINRDWGDLIAPLPGFMYLTSIHDNGKSIVIQGTAPNGDMVLDYARSLRQNENYKVVSVDSLTSASYNQTQFQITLTPDR
ncbi:MAG: PilN domain-containing protein [Dehalococcoidia bacterium]|jgi:type IV pilus assembly protein PilM